MLRLGTAHKQIERTVAVKQAACFKGILNVATSARQSAFTKWSDPGNAATFFRFRFIRTRSARW